MPPARRTAALAALTGGALALASFATLAPASGATEAMSPAPVHGHRVVLPTVEGARAGRALHAAGAASGSGSLTYHGGVGGVGVTTGAPRVYLVFWGSQWGTASTDANGDTALTGDASGMAPRLQEMFKGLGTGGELWSGVMTQFCDGVASGASSCPANAAHVGYPTGGGVLAGVWVDSAAAAPAQASANQLGTEAYAAVQHFGNLSAAANRNVQYVVVSPTGTHPGGYNTTSGNFCAWHDYNVDAGVTSAYGPFAFTNLPYIPDMGASCGASYVNAGSAGLLDGVTMVEGHEYAETITDQFPSGGWWDASGAENADKCSWNGVGGTGGSQNVTFANGTFPMQATYSNDGAACRISHAIVTYSSNVVTVTPPSSVTATKGVAVTSGAPSATDSVSPATFAWSATGLPAGVTVSSATGVLSGTPTATGTFSVVLRATDQTGAYGTATVAVTVKNTSVSVTSPGAQRTPRSTTITPLTMKATDTNPAITTFTWSASGLPSGLSISSSTGVISGRTGSTAKTYTVTVTAKDANNASGSYTFTWAVV
jgi:hypothetical protein